MTSAPYLLRGRRVATLLAGAWRRHPPIPDLDARSCAEMIPRLVRTGAGALAWWKLRNHFGAARLEFGELRRIHALHKLEAFMQESRLEFLFERLRQSGADALLSKGWTVARHYPELGLRPYGDFDLHIDPSHDAQARQALLSSYPAHAWVDLHYGVPELPERSIAALRERARFLEVRATLVPTLGAEDQLRQLCLHFARHGGWRPLWLCDVGMLLESLPCGFDWDYCMSGDPRRSAWVRAVLGLAVRLLDARPDALPDRIAFRTGEWLDQVVLGEWGRDDPGDSHSRDKLPMASYWTRPWLVWRAARRRIPNALEAAFRRNADPDAETTLRWHRFRFCWSRAHRFARRLSSLWRESRAAEITVHDSGD